jgi:hypothetical protein
MRFPRHQATALQAGYDLGSFFEYHVREDSWRTSSLKRTAAGILLDEFYGDEVERICERYEYNLPPPILVLPWALVCIALCFSFNLRSNTFP